MVSTPSGVPVVYGAPSLVNPLTMVNMFGMLLMLSTMTGIFSAVVYQVAEFERQSIAVEYVPFEHTLFS